MGLDDRHALQAAIEAAKLLSSEPVVLTCIGRGESWSPREAHARGAKSLMWIPREEELDDSAETAASLARAIGMQEGVKLVICADGSEDRTSRQVPVRIAAHLDWPVITRVRRLSIGADEVHAERQIDRCIEEVVCRLPAVVAVLPEAAPAPIPGVLQILAARDGIIEELPTSDYPVANCVRVEERKLDVEGQERLQSIFNTAEDPLALAKFWESLSHEGAHTR